MHLRTLLCAGAAALLLAGCAATSAGSAASSRPRPHATAKKTTHNTPAATASGTPPAKPPASTPPAGAVPELQKVDMLTGSLGWALLTDGRVLQTSDGGLHWTDVSPHALQGTLPASEQVAAAFPDMRHAIVLVGQGSGGLWSSLTAYLTSDGGQTWSTAALSLQKVPFGTYVNGFQVRFINDAEGWVLLHEGAAAGNEAVTLLRTTDGGAQWSIVANGTPTPQNPPTLFAGDKSGLGFLDSEHGWITGGWPASSILLYSTADGGATWHLQNLTVPPGLSAGGGAAESLPPAFFGPSNGVLPVTFQSPSVETVFYQTTDGGAVWEPTTPVASNVGAWSFSDLTDGFVTSFATLYRTTDGGEHWTALQPNMSLQNTTQLDFVDAQTGWAVVNGTLLTTSNGGQTWSQIPLKISSNFTTSNQN